MENFYTLLSNTGINAIIAARASNSEVKLTKIAVGDGDIIPSQDMTALKSEKHRFNINSIIQDIDNPNYLIVEGVIPSNVGGFYVSEVAIYTDQNTLFAIGSLPKTYKPLLEEGSAKDLTIKIFLEVTNADSVTLKVDDSVVLATKNYVQNELKKYAFLNGDELQNFRVKDAINSFDAVNSRTLNYALKKLIPAGIMSIWTGTIAPDGYLIANGAVLNRSAYKDLWAFAEKSGNITTESDWAENKKHGKYTFGDNNTTFRIPDLRGYFIRGMGGNSASLGVRQSDENKKHFHIDSYLDKNGGVTGVNNPSTAFVKMYVTNNSISAPFVGSLGGAYTDFSGEIEARPVNIALNYIIKY